MYAIELDQQTITLFVTDLERSRHFYEELIGLSGRPAGGGILLEGIADELESETPGQKLQIQLLPRGMDEPEASWLSVEVAGVTEVLDLYLLSIILGSRAVLPRKKADRWITVLTDPDGNRLSIWSPVSEDSTTPGRRVLPVTRAERSPRLEWEMSHRRGYDAQQQELLKDGIDLNPGHGVHRPVPGRHLDDVVKAPGRDALPAREGV